MKKILKRNDVVCNYICVLLRIIYANGMKITEELRHAIRLLKIGKTKKMKIPRKVVKNIASYKIHKRNNNL